jgi:predicted RNA-binding Zn-ribbon protein involved in translation (DUF1610 family)
MEIKFHCAASECRQRIAVDESLSGQSFTCPRCGLQQIIPDCTTSAPVAGRRIERRHVPATRPPKSFLARFLTLAGLSLLAALTLAIPHQLRAWRLPAGTARVIDEITAVGAFKAAPLANHDGTRLWYVRDTEAGLALFQVDLTTLVRTRIAVAVADQKFALHPCSPDNRFFLFETRAQSTTDQGELFIFDTSTGKVADKFRVFGPLRGLIWLSASDFAVFDDAGVISRFTLNPGLKTGKLGRSSQTLAKLNRSVAKGPLLALSSESLAFVQSGQIHSIDLNTKLVERFTDMPEGLSFDWLNYNAKSGGFLFCSPVEGDDRKFRYLHSVLADGNGGWQLTRPLPERVFNAQWLSSIPKAYAYVSSQTNRTYLALRFPNSTGSTNLFEGGYVLSYSVGAGGTKVYAIASVGSEPRGVWEYDIGVRNLRCVVPPTDHPFSKAMIIEPTRHHARGSDGGDVPYFQLRPQTMAVGRKYPLVIGPAMQGHWSTESQVLANLGAIYCAPDRWGLSSSDFMAESAEDMVAVLEEMLKNSAVDPAHVYLCGYSAGSVAIKRVLDAHPKRFKGAWVLSPVAFPSEEALALTSAKFSMQCGELDSNRKSFDEFEQTACRQRIPLQIERYSNSGHIFEAISDIRNRNKKLVELIFSHL